MSVERTESDYIERLVNAGAEGAQLPPPSTDEEAVFLRDFEDTSAIFASFDPKLDDDWVAQLWAKVDAAEPVAANDDSSPSGRVIDARGRFRTRATILSIVAAAAVLLLVFGSLPEGSDRVTPQRAPEKASAVEVAIMSEGEPPPEETMSPPEETMSPPKAPRARATAPAAAVKPEAETKNKEEAPNDVASADKTLNTFEAQPSPSVGMRKHREKAREQSMKLLVADDDFDAAAAPTEGKGKAAEEVALNDLERFAGREDDLGAPEKGKRMARRPTMKLKTKKDEHKPAQDPDVVADAMNAGDGMDSVDSLALGIGAGAGGGAEVIEGAGGGAEVIEGAGGAEPLGDEAEAELGDASSEVYPLLIAGMPSWQRNTITIGSRSQSSVSGYIELDRGIGPIAREPSPDERVHRKQFRAQISHSRFEFSVQVGAFSPLEYRFAFALCPDAGAAECASVRGDSLVGKVWIASPGTLDEGRWEVIAPIAF